MSYATYSLDRDIAMSKSCLNIHPSYIEQRIEEKNFIVDYVNIDYSMMNSEYSNLQYTGKIASEKYPLSMMQKDIKDLLKNKLNYDISVVHVSELKDDEEIFTVLTMELILDSLDYSKIIDDEYEISEELGYKNGNTVKNMKYKCLKRLRFMILDIYKQKK